MWSLVGNKNTETTTEQSKTYKTRSLVSTKIPGLPSKKELLFIIIHC